MRDRMSETSPSPGEGLLSGRGSQSFWPQQGLSDRDKSSPGAPVIMRGTYARWVFIRKEFSVAIGCNKKLYLMSSVSGSACPTLCNPMDCSPPGSSFHGISRQEYWNGLPFPSPGDLPDSGIEPGSPALSGRLFTF